MDVRGLQETTLTQQTTKGRGPSSRAADLSLITKHSLQSPCEDALADSTERVISYGCISAMV
jgi:hypothetical protein